MNHPEVSHPGVNHPGVSHPGVNHPGVNHPRSIFMTKIKGENVDEQHSLIKKNSYETENKT